MGYLSANQQPTVSPECIYYHQRIYADKRRGGQLHLALRCQKPRKTRRTGRERRGTIIGQVSIELRPECVNRRERLGDWEANLVIGAGQKQALVPLNERRSRYSLIAHLRFKTAALVSAAISTLLTPDFFCRLRAYSDHRQRQRACPARGKLKSAQCRTLLRAPLLLRGAR